VRVPRPRSRAGMGLLAGPDRDHCRTAGTNPHTVRNICSSRHIHAPPRPTASARARASGPSRRAPLKEGRSGRGARLLLGPVGQRSGQLPKAGAAGPRWIRARATRRGACRRSRGTASCGQLGLAVSEESRRRREHVRSARAASSTRFARPTVCRRVPAPRS
jgi:hypothetical protein